MNYSHKLPRRRSAFARWIILVLAPVVLFGCGGETKPRSVEEINAERDSLPALYMTESGKRIEAVKTQGIFVEEESGELAWPVYECANPDCPGRTPQEPHLFIWTDPRFFVTPEGTLGTREFSTARQWREAVEEAGTYRQPTCEKCLQTRNLTSESPEQAQKFAEYPRRYTLPKTVQRMKELDAEHQERIDYINQRIRGD